MTSMWAQYLREKTDTDMIETDKGFATYRFMDDGSVYIVDIYTLPDFRHSRVASELADKVADIGRSRGAKKMFGSINLKTKQCDDSLKVLQAYGFKLHSTANGDFLLMSKEI